MSIDTSFIPLSQADEPDFLSFGHALSDATRLQIMQLCCCQWCSVGEIVESLGGRVGQPTVSHHLSVLREAGLVKQRRDGRLAFYQLDQERVSRCCERIDAVLAPGNAEA